jgi:hypothetical protein
VLLRKTKEKIVKISEIITEGRRKKSRKKSQKRSRKSAPLVGWGWGWPGATATDSGAGADGGGMAESHDLDFKTTALLENQISSYVREFHQAYSRQEPFQKYISNIRRFSSRKLAESRELEEITPFIDAIHQQDTLKKIQVGDQFSVLAFEIIFAWREINVLGFLEPEQVSKIHLHPSGAINYIEFASGDRYPRIAPAEYSGKPTVYTAFFNSKSAAESALTFQMLKVPENWTVETQLDLKNLTEGKPRDGLDKWFRERWVNIGSKKKGRYQPCGTSGENQAYAKCVPAKTAAGMSQKEKASAVRRKRQAQSQAGRPGRASGGSGKSPIRVNTKTRKKS